MSFIPEPARILLVYSFPGSVWERTIHEAQPRCVFSRVAWYY